VNLHRSVPVLVALLALSIPASISAETFRLVAADGTVHYTNAPMDPSYKRMGIAPAAAVTRVDADVDQHVRQASTRYGVSEKLVSAVIRAESGFNPRAVSRKGARGLMQLMPQTASMLGVRDSFDPAENIDGGVRHLRMLIERFRNDLPLALAAYNAGENAVLHYRGIPPYPETQDYVQKVLRFFHGVGGTPLAPIVYPTYKFTEADGTVVYSNLPPPSAARLVRR
jgi:soluble lytic murein transglycosylase